MTFMSPEREGVQGLQTNPFLPSHAQGCRSRVEMKGCASATLASE